MKIVATTSLPAVDRPNADRWNAARSRQKSEISDRGGGGQAYLGKSPQFSRFLIMTAPLKDQLCLILKLEKISIFF